MVNFLSEIAQATGLDFDTAVGGWRYTVFGMRACYVEGFRAVLGVDDTRVRLAVRDAILSVTGRNLVVRDLCRGSIVVTGTAVSVVAEGLICD